jgi:prephenate dehydrogenase
MSAGNPIEKRPPIAGLRPDEVIAVTGVTAPYCEDREAVGDVARKVLESRRQKRAGASDLLIVAIPHGRAAAVLREIERGLTDA